MASNVEGSVVVDVDMNVNDAEKELARLKNEISKAENEIAVNLKKKDVLTERLETAKAKYIELQKSLRGFKTGELNVNPEAIKIAEQMQETEKYISRTEKEIEKVNLAIERGKVETDTLKLLFSELTQEAASMGNKMVSPLSSVEEKLSSILEKLRQQQLVVGAVNQELMDAVGIQDKVKGLAQEFTIGTKIAFTELAQVGIKPLNKMIGIFSTRVSKATKQQKELSNETKKSAGNMGSFNSRLKGILASAFIFNILSAGLQSMTRWMGSAVKSSAETQKAIAKLKGSLLTLVQPIFNVVIPAFTALINVLSQIVSTASNLISGLFGTTAEKSAESAESLYNQSNAIGAVGKSADKASKSLAGFDEINQISGEKNTYGGGSGGSGIAPDFTSPIVSKITEIAELFTGVALMAIGAVLTFTGANMPVGLGLMAIGALAIGSAISSNPELAAIMVQNGLNRVLQIVGAMIAIIGVILAVTGHLLLGIGMIVAGVSIFGVGESMGEDGDFVENIKSKLSDAVTVIGSLIAVVGVVLLVSGHIMPGIGMILAGITLLEVGSVSDDDGKTMQDKIVKVLKETSLLVGPLIAIIGIVFMVTGKFLLGLGLILCVCQEKS